MKKILNYYETKKKEVKKGCHFDGSKEQEYDYI